MVTIRHYKEEDAQKTWQLFHNTIRTVNRQHYSAEQVEAWAPDDYEFEKWQKTMDETRPFIAEIDDEIVGFADLQADGYIDYFFCHADHQGQGVGRALMEKILKTAADKQMPHLYSNVSITARPFYEKFGFGVAREQQLELQGVKLTNFRMEKFNEPGSKTGN